MIDTLTHDEEELLLGRSVVPLLTDEDRAQFAGRICLITGAGGSVGSELARQLAACRPARLILLDHSEHALFSVEQALREQSPDTAIEVVLADVTRRASIARIFRRLRPEMVFHAAAYKHVTMAERAICAAARVNVLGTSAVLDAAREVGARFVLISSDKAAAPRSVMGATKRLAEIVALSDRDLTTRAIAVRFGNVLASSGSFVDVMRRRIRQGKPLLVTDPDATRFFMTVAEAASLVLKAATLSEGGETFWLDMGRQVRIGDLADRLIAGAARQGIPAVPIQTIGLRPGEKMVEQLASQGTRLDRTECPRIWVARQQPLPAARPISWTQAISKAVGRDDAYAVLTTLTAAVRDFEPSAHAWHEAHTASGRPCVPVRSSAARRAPLAPRSLERAPVRTAASLGRAPMRIVRRPELAAVLPMRQRTESAARP